MNDRALDLRADWVASYEECPIAAVRDGLAKTLRTVREMAHRKMTVNQQVALGSLAHDMGTAWLRSSLLMSDFELGNLEGAAARFTQGTLSPMRKLRRQHEAMLFLLPDVPVGGSNEG